VGELVTLTTRVTEALMNNKKEASGPFALLWHRAITPFTFDVLPSFS
jgi:hypothetical protein